jgi:hypothetical protein
MGQMGHKDARLTLAVDVQTMQRQQVDRDLVWRQMRFSDAPETLSSGGPFDTTGSKRAVGLPAGGLRGDQSDHDQRSEDDPDCGPTRLV